MLRIFFIAVLLTLSTACANSYTNYAADVKRTVVPAALKSNYESFKYAPAVRAGDFLFLSGVVATIEPGETQNTPAIERAFDEIELILSEARASWSDVVDVTSYMTDFDEQIGPLWAVKEKRVPAPHPAWTAIGVDRLFGGEPAIIEIKVTAYLPVGR